MKKKKILQNSGRIKEFIDYRKQKLNDHNENIIKINEEKEQIREISRAILLKKGYEDPSLIKNINYSLVEESSPKYTIKGKNLQKNINFQDYGSLLFNENEEPMNLIINSQLNRPLPNLNYVRPKLPSISFSKAERFKTIKKEYESSTFLFKDGIFSPKTQEDFFLKEPFSGKAQRTFFSNKKEITPSPAEYKIKSSFELIAEQGKKISENKKRIQIKEMKEMERKQKQDNSKILNLNFEKKNQKKDS